mmetsp:Transcript_19827/g.31057  ORF Transcript_19827/g.31057 Transcript_19827/m.31057 type:complete len:313 (-) Transcript_19827:35-973(-)
MVAKSRRKTSPRAEKKQNWITKLSKEMKRQLREDIPAKESGPGNSSSQENTSESNCCVVLKKIPLKCDESDVRNRMKRFGTVKKVLLVRPKESATHSGTGFVYFKSSNSTNKVLQRSRENFRQSSESTAPFITLNGQKVQCHEVSAGTRENHTRDVRTHAGAHKDSRNLYLLLEGRIDETKNDVSQSDMTIRRSLYKENMKKLQNPNYHISTTRLKILNLPQAIDDKQIKQLFRRYGRLRQCKILRDRAGNSKGIAFVEFIEHSCALNALRQLNNNPSVWSRKNRPIVEFAIDDICVLQRRNQKSRDHVPPE